jgi:hypothetical protein
VRGLVVGLTALCACGRFGFESRDQSGGDGGGGGGDADGEVVPVPCTPTRDTLATDATSASIAWSGTTFGVVWQAANSVLVTTIDAQGARGATMTVHSGDMPSAGEIIVRSGGFAASWYEFDTTQSRHQVGFALLDAAGGTTASSLNVRDNAAAAGFSVYLPIVPHTAGYAVGMTDMRSGGGNYSVFASPVTAGAAKAGPDIALVPGTRRILQDMAASGGSYIVAFTAGASDDLYLGRRGMDGSVVGTDVLVSAATSNLAEIDVAGEVGIVWAETNRLRFARYALDLTPIGAWDVEGSVSAGDVAWPSITRAGADWIVTWIETLNSGDVLHDTTISNVGAELATFSEPVPGGSGETTVQAAPGAHVTLWSDGTALELRIGCDL